MISIIAAIDSKRGLGKNNDLLFKIPEDFKRMQKITKGHPIIMGRKTFESIGRVLPGRTNIIVTRDLGFKINDSGKGDVRIVRSLEEGIEAAKLAPGSEEIIIFGGGQIFTEAIEKGLVDRLYLTVVEGDYNVDTFFPDYSKFSVVVSREPQSSNGLLYEYLVLERR